MINIVLIAGGFSFYSNNNSILQYFITKYNDPDVNIIEVYPPPFSSNFDSACYAFYQLKGGRTYFGEEHAKKYGHNVYCAQYDNPLLPEWDENNPIHILGHSHGGHTAQQLQFLLESKHFPGHNTSKEWIKSITFLATPFKGSINGVVSYYVATLPIIKQLLFLYTYTGVSNYLLPLLVRQWNIEKDQVGSISEAYNNYLKYLASDDIDFAKTSYRDLLVPDEYPVYDSTYYFLFHTYSIIYINLFFFGLYVPYDILQFTLNPFRLFIRIWGYIVSIATYLFYMLNGKKVKVKDIFTTDGVVTFYSSKAPNNIPVYKISFDEDVNNIKPGTYYRLARYRNMTHIDPLGFLYHRDQGLFNKYFDFIKRLESK
ncbi:hypothetical protein YASMINEVIRUS_582 [Yasminevirus sp. GU-2018]|uniref:Lipase-like C-terminal domain-containing protein n=1 Tax=Yasminevirus sp. GU-2018 TaxID=2420051 RepID=A0A5K0U7U1_9VIRU|nr:hypothetical protein YASMINEVIRUS_582 [Yasminevirus sp. GU-2018]